MEISCGNRYGQGLYSKKTLVYLSGVVSARNIPLYLRLNALFLGKCQSIVHYFFVIYGSSVGNRYNSATANLGNSLVRICAGQIGYSGSFKNDCKVRSCQLCRASRSRISYFLANSKAEKYPKLSASTSVITFKPREVFS